MENNIKREVWQRGPVENIPDLLQPVAHAILQAREEVDEILNGFPEEYLWQKPAGVASVGFHLQHLKGVLDRLYTYARGESLNEEQNEWLLNEGKAVDGTGGVAKLLSQFHRQVDKSLEQLSGTAVHELAEKRFVGRAKIPSTVSGLLFHAAEHTMRHVGQLYVTAKIIRDRARKGL